MCLFPPLASWRDVLRVAMIDDAQSTLAVCFPSLRASAWCVAQCCTKQMHQANAEENVSGLGDVAIGII